MQFSSVINTYLQSIQQKNWGNMTSCNKLKNYFFFLLLFHLIIEHSIRERFEKDFCLRNCLIIFYFDVSLFDLLQSYFVVKSLHFLKESKYFPLSFPYYEISGTISYETKKSWKRLKKIYRQNWGVSSVTLPWKDIQTCRFYAQSRSVKYMSFKNQNKDTTVSLWYLYLIFSSFIRYFWRFWPYAGI